MCLVRSYLGWERSYTQSLHFICTINDCAHDVNMAEDICIYCHVTCGVCILVIGLRRAREVAVVPEVVVVVVAAGFVLSC